MPNPREKKQCTRCRPHDVYYVEQGRKNAIKRKKKIKIISGNVNVSFPLGSRVVIVEKYRIV